MPAPNSTEPPSSGARRIDWQHVPHKKMACPAVTQRRPWIRSLGFPNLQAQGGLDSPAANYAPLSARFGRHHEVVEPGGADLFSVRFGHLRTQVGHLPRSEKCQREISCASRRSSLPGRDAASLTKHSDTNRSGLGCEYVAVTILGQRADVRHQPVRPRNDELVGNRTIKNLLARFRGHLRVLIDRLLPVRVC